MYICNNKCCIIMDLCYNGCSIGNLNEVIMDLKQQLVEKFKQAVAEQGISRADIATDRCVSRQAVDNYFHGRCSEQVLIDLLDWMGYSVELVLKFEC